MFVDKVKVYLKAGKGGDGAVSFRREKYVPNGGADGGDGGRGGSIVLEIDEGANSLIDFRYNKHYRAEEGQRGSGKKSSGKSGSDLVIKVPRGTVVRDARTSKVIADMFGVNDSVVLLRGGNGGKGNFHYVSSRRQAPRFSQSGQVTEEKEVILELKTVADVGLIGFPNVGKSTILSAITEAKPKIANYHFTTLAPNLGVLESHDRRCVLADIPGLIEGASDGIGLGHEFLRHIERVRLLVHVVDISGSEGREPYEDFQIINNELIKYSKELKKRPQVIVLNKYDLLSGESSLEQEFRNKLRKLKGFKEAPVLTVSATAHKGLDELVSAIFDELIKLPPLEATPIEEFDFDRRDTSEIEVLKLDAHTFEVVGGRIDELARKVVLSDYESMAYFQRRLRTDGIIDLLKRSGMVEGDTVLISDIEFEYNE